MFRDHRAAFNILNGLNDLNFWNVCSLKLLSHWCVFQLLEFCPPLSWRGVMPVKPFFTTSTSGEKNYGNAAAPSLNILQNSICSCSERAGVMIELSSSKIASFFGSFQPETFSGEYLFSAVGNVFAVKTFLPLFDRDVMRTDVRARPAVAVLRRS